MSIHIPDSELRAIGIHCDHLCQFEMKINMHKLIKFSTIDHSANFARIVLVEYTIGSVAEFIFFKDLPKILQRFYKVWVK